MPLDKYYDYLKDPNNSFPTTSQPAIGEVVSCLEKLKEEGYTDVIAIALSSGISGTFSSYSVADLMVDGINVYPFDSEVACHPEGYYAIKAAGLIKEGKSSKEIIATLDEMKKVSKAYFMADDLSHLQRSGRLNGAQAIVGNLLQVKPLLHFEDKVIVPFQKIRTYKKVVLRIYELFDEFYRQHKDENISVCILHVDALETAEDKFTLVYLTLPGSDYELELTYNYDHGAYDLGDGYGHIAISVSDLESLYEKHKEAGYDVTDLKGLPGFPPSYYFIKDPDGYKIEVIRDK